MAYVYAQAAQASSKGLPLVKALFLNYPDDPAAWMIEDQYLLGNDLLVAPILETETNSRTVYLPAGKWVDYQSREVYEGNSWHHLTAGPLPGILLVRWGSLIPHIALAPSTAFMDWSKIELVAFSNGEIPAEGEYYLQSAGELVPLKAALFDGVWELVGVPPEGTTFEVRGYSR
jgi:alpha-D-xyloside xylohydrolase